MSLAPIMGDYLKRIGANNVLIKGIKRYSNSILHSIMINCLVNGFTIKEGNFVGRLYDNELGIEIYTPKREGVTVRYGIEKGQFNFDPSLIPAYPKFVVDMKLWNYLTDEERKDLIRQIGLSISVIRRYFWDENLVIANQPSCLDSMLNYMFKDFSYRVPRRFKLERDSIVLDPYAEDEINEDLIRRTKVFIIGGIVDKGKRFDRATEYLTKVSGYQEVKGYKITLRSSIIGVPDRINKILEILMKVIQGSTLEEAIIEEQTTSEKLARARYEIAKGNNDLSWLKINDRLVKKLKGE
ncbi:hypothetical protein [Sulfuracidifex metallicus]|uniref:hypothetical protein n=1 Tax=Sulfuracidifex metallicus TaxID=47303 RepID=UPI002272B04E|nr:hypothetical protein [Sulfuracidifex metallicus]MCY0849804.1 hypothetical protein [Sulfuracidifex metallicus]